MALRLRGGDIAPDEPHIPIVPQVDIVPVTIAGTGAMADDAVDGVQVNRVGCRKQAIVPVFQGAAFERHAACVRDHQRLRRPAANGTGEHHVLDDKTHILRHMIAQVEQLFASIRDQSAGTAYDERRARIDAIRGSVRVYAHTPLRRHNVPGAIRDLDDTAIGMVGIVRRRRLQFPRSSRCCNIDGHHGQIAIIRQGLRIGRRVGDRVRRWVRRSPQRFGSIRQPFSTVRHPRRNGRHGVGHLRKITHRIPLFQWVMGTKPYAT